MDFWDGSARQVCFLRGFLVPDFRQFTKAEQAFTEAYAFQGILREKELGGLLKFQRTFPLFRRVLGHEIICAI